MPCSLAPIEARGHRPVVCQLCDIPLADIRRATMAIMNTWAKACAMQHWLVRGGIANRPMAAPSSGLPPRVGDWARDLSWR